MCKSGARPSVNKSLRERASRSQSRQSAQLSELAPPAPSPAPLWLHGGTHPLAGEGAVGANSDEGTDILVL